MADENLYIYGRNAVIEALVSGKPVEKVFISFGVQGDSINRIHGLCKKRRTPVVVYDRKKFERFEKDVCKIPLKAQGVIALLRNFDLITINDLIESAYMKSDKPVLVALDEIEDPQNLGAIARSAECAGAAGLILPEKNSAPVTPVAVKASAGALEHLPVCKVSSFPQTFDKLKDKGFWIIGTDADAEKYYCEDIYDSPVVIVIGSEGKGLRPSTKSNCDILIKIPMAGQINSLNASVSAGIVLFEILRQRELPDES